MLRLLLAVTAQGVRGVLGEQKVHGAELLLNIKIAGVGSQLQLGTQHGEG